MVQVALAESEIEAEVICGYLRSEGIRCGQRMAEPVWLIGLDRVRWYLDRMRGGRRPRSPGGDLPVAGWRVFVADADAARARDALANLPGEGSEPT